ncbi:MAG: erythronate-4-phosphate dehydrogenase, partial [Bacteroidales bacterium]|nr:erythronate-4-phosphate dehydrogenase [Bacteroidales bacterium]
MKIVIDDKIPFIRGVLEPFAETAYVRGSVLTRAEAVDADALIVRTRTQCNEALLKGTRVRFIATATIGFDHIDTQWCRANGIAWANASGCNAGSVRQYIAAALCALAVHHGFSFGEVTLGVVGAGNVGGKVARLGETLCMKVLVNDPPRARREGAGNFVSLEEIVRRCDIVTLHVPLNRQGEDKTLHL